MRKVAINYIWGPMPGNWEQRLQVGKNIFGSMVKIRIKFRLRQVVVFKEMNLSM